jgi:uncharacterized peroxidase-related enzyme
MNRVPLIDRSTATGPTRELLDAVQAAFGATPAMFRATANSPAALQAMWGFFGALSASGGGTLGAKLGEQVAVAVAERNGCHYCLAAHTLLGRKAGASEAEMAAAQGGEAADARTAAALRFAVALVERRGRVDAEAVQALKASGFDDGQVVELVAHVALNLFTNYVNNALGTPVDFPAVKLKLAA